MNDPPRPLCLHFHFSQEGSLAIRTREEDIKMLKLQVRGKYPTAPDPSIGADDRSRWSTVYLARPV